jgi:hypothetical protein
MWMWSLVLNESLLASVFQTLPGQCPAACR